MSYNREKLNKSPRKCEKNQKPNRPSVKKTGAKNDQNNGNKNINGELRIRMKTN
jgi:hypothetical protein